MKKHNEKISGQNIGKGLSYRCSKNKSKQNLFKNHNFHIFWPILRELIIHHYIEKNMTLHNVYSILLQLPKLRFNVPKCSAPLSILKILLVW